MFDPIFCSDCPFAAFMRVSNAQRKSFVRTVDHIRYAAMNYNRHNGFSSDDPRFIYFKHIEIFDERNDLNEIAYMSFEQNNGELWLVAITQYKE